MILFFPVKIWSQISGQLYQDGYPYPMVKVYFEDIKPRVSTDFDGNFSLRIPNDSIPNTLIFSYNGINLHITNCPLEASEKLDLGKYILPKYKQLTVEEYKQLKRKERKQCRPLYQGSNLIGYESNHQLESPLLQLHCKEGEGIPYSYDPKLNRFCVTWDSFRGCK
jgi:hypothetical protein